MSQLRAGGGTSSDAAQVKSLKTLSPALLTYLQSVASNTNALDRSQLAEICPNGHDIAATGRLDFKTLLNYMTSSKSNAQGPLDDCNLEYSISNYFISSSHNTYLTGNQLYGQSSTDAYRDVLLRGCRCIEIDVWNGAPKGHEKDEKKMLELGSHVTSSIDSFLQRHAGGKVPTQPLTATKVEELQMPTPWKSTDWSDQAEPRVLHGHTLIKEVPFRDVCISIRDSAFTISELPVIVSLEIHTTPEQQEMMVDIMEEVWIGMLVNTSEEDCSKLPKLSQLRRKILVKVKHGAGKSYDSSKPTLDRLQSNASNSDSEGREHSDSHAKHNGEIVRRLSALGIYTRSYHFKGLTQPEAEIPSHVFSLSEKKLMEVHQSHGPTLFSHNRNFLMRAFPSGMRVSSSNLDPVVFWRKGVQMVALNWQKWDEGMMLNESLFAGTGGWVLKPKGYRGNGDRIQAVSHESQADAIAHKTLNLSIEIFAAQDLPLPLGCENEEKFHPYVKIELHVERSEERSGAAIDKDGKSKDGEHKRRTDIGKGSAPDFRGQPLTFSNIPMVVEELSFVRFKIQNHEIMKDELACWACIRLDRLRSSYRFVHMIDVSGDKTQGVLLVRISKTLE